MFKSFILFQLSGDRQGLKWSFTKFYKMFLLKRQGLVEIKGRHYYLIKISHSSTTSQADDALLGAVVGGFVSGGLGAMVGAMVGGGFKKHETIYITLMNESTNEHFTIRGKYQASRGNLSKFQPKAPPKRRKANVAVTIDGVGKENIVNQFFEKTSSGNRVTFVLKDQSKIILDVYDGNLKVSPSLEGPEKHMVEVIHVEDIGTNSRRVTFKRKNGRSYTVEIGEE